eukprot:2759182-Prymnesium_polylepis.2
MGAHARVAGPLGDAELLFAAPEVRHLWGDPQHTLHAGGQELFLDLIFVGVAYEVGTVLKPAFYSCTQEAAYDTAGSNTTGGSGSAGSYSSEAEGYPECIGLARGLLHAVAPFLCMYMLWSIETSYRSRFVARGLLHQGLDLTGNLLLILAVFAVEKTHLYRGKPDVARAGVGVAQHLVWVIAAFVIWIFRTLQIAFFGKREAARR